MHDDPLDDDLERAEVTRGDILNRLIKAGIDVAKLFEEMSKSSMNNVISIKVSPIEKALYVKYPWVAKAWREAARHLLWQLIEKLASSPINGMSMIHIENLSVQLDQQELQEKEELAYIRKMKKDLDFYRREVNRLSKENMELQEKLKQYESERSELERKIAMKYEQMLNQKQAKIEELEDRVRRLEPLQSGELVKQLEKLNQKYSEALQKNKQLEKQVKDLENEKNEREAMIAEYEKEISRLKRENEELKAEIDDLERSWTECEKHRACLEKNLNEEAVKQCRASTA